MKRGLLVMAGLTASGALLLFALGGLQDLSKYESRNILVGANSPSL